jgi:RNA polymerase sigma-70 factor (ECF subfamily)
MSADASRAEPESDEALRRFAGGDDSAFEALVHAHQDHVFRLALALLGRRDDARDAAQEVFLRAFRGLRAFRFESRLSTWLHRLTVNVCRESRRKWWSEARKRGRWMRLMAPLARPGASAREAEALEGRAGSLVAALPPRQREVVVLRVFADLSVAETADVLGVPEGTVKSNFAKAIAALRARLEGEANR